MFQKLKVVELASVLAGPAVGMFFAELGAKVIKIENKTTKGDVTRSWKNTNENSDSSVSAYFSSVNWGKELLLLDYSDADDLNKAISELSNADIVITNFKSGDAEKFGLDFNSIQKINPKVIYGNISGFGTNDHRVAYDVVLQAESGFMSMNGTPESGPVKMPVALIDVLAAHQLKEALLLALLKKEKTGNGGFVEVSLFETAVCSLVNQASNYLMSGLIPKPSGSLHPNIAPYGETFETSDKKLMVLAVGSDEQFTKLCHLIHLDALKENQEFKTNAGRVKNRKKLFEILQPEIKKLNLIELVKSLREKNIPAGTIRSLDEVFADENIRKLILEESINGFSTKRIKSISFNTDFLHD